MARGKCSPNEDSTLVADMANLAAGGTLLPKKEWGPVLDSRIGNSFRPNDRETQAARDQRFTQYAAHQHMEANAKATFLEHADLARAPGISPLTKAVMVLKALSSRSGGYKRSSLCKQSRLSGDTSEESGESTLGSCGHDHAENMATTMNSVLDDIERLPDDFLRLLDERGDTDSGASELFAMDDHDASAMLSVARKIGESPLVTTTRRRGTKVSPHGAEKETRALRNLSQLRSLTARSRTQLAMGPLGRAKLIMGGLRYARRFDYLDQKSLLYVLCDCSGSMNTPTRRGTALGCLHALASAVQAGAAELFLRFFDGEVTSLETLTDPDEAGAWLRKQRESLNFSGGCTRIGFAVNTAIRDITDRTGPYRSNVGDLVHPEILLVTDGEDSVSLKLSELRGVKLHMVQIGQSENDVLKALVQENRGLYLKVGG